MTSSMELGGFDFTAPASPRGGRFQMLVLEGWHTVTQGRDRQEKMQQPGAWPSTGYAGSLRITASGIARYTSPAAAATERRELMAVGGGGRYPMTVTDAAGSGTRTVEVDALTVTPLNELQFAWTLAVTAYDPVLYGDEVYDKTVLSSVAAGAGLTYPLAYPLDYGAAAGVTPGQVRAANAGTTSYHPRLQIDGPVTNPVITLAETGDRLSYAGTIPAGQFLDIDCARRRVAIAARSQPDRAVSMRQLLSFVGSWLAIPIGGGTLTWTADTADPAATLTVRSYEGAWS